MPRAEGIWPDSHIAAMKEFLAAGMTARKCADAINSRFGTDYSRNAVCGVAWRSKTAYVKPQKERKPRPRRPAAAKAVVVIRPKPKPLLTDNRTGFRCADVEPLHLSLIELHDGMCKWPYGDGPFTFCGHPTLGGDTYCVEHMALSLPEPKDRRAA